MFLTRVKKIKFLMFFSFFRVFLIFEFFFLLTVVFLFLFFQFWSIFLIEKGQKVMFFGFLGRFWGSKKRSFFGHFWCFSGLLLFGSLLVIKKWSKIWIMVVNKCRLNYQFI